MTGEIKPLLKIDLHLHTCFSADSALRPADMIKIARRKGLDRICITDHNSIEGAQAAHNIDPDFVIIGEEILTGSGGEILAFFVREWVPSRLSPAETIERLEAQGAVISVAHPFDRYRNRPWNEELLAALAPRLDAIEAFNARTIHAQDNEKARAFAASQHLAMTAGSDAHTAMEVGAAYLEIPAFTTAEQFRANLPAAVIYGQLSPVWAHLFSIMNKWRGRFGLKPKA